MYSSIFKIDIEITTGCKNIKENLCYDSNLRGVAQFGSAPAWGAGGRWFESSHPAMYFEN